MLLGSGGMWRRAGTGSTSAMRDWSTTVYWHVYWMIHARSISA